MDIGRVAGPAEPEEAGGKGDAAEDGGRKTPLGDGHAVICGQFAVIGRVEGEDEQAGEELADDEAEVGEAGDAVGEAVDAVEDDRVGGHEEVEQAVEEGHVEAEEEEDGLRDEHAERAAEVLADELGEVDLDLLLLGVDAPVPGAAAQVGGLLDEDDRGVGLADEEEVEDEGGGAGEAGEVGGPAPAESGAVDDEAADEGGEERAGEDGHGEDGDGEAAVGVVVHVGEDGGDDGDGAGAKEAAEEAADDDGLQVLGRGDGELEDGEAEHADEDGQASAEQLGQRREQRRPAGEAEHVQRQAQRADFGRDVVLRRDGRVGGRVDAAREGRVERRPR